MGNLAPSKKPTPLDLERVSSSLGLTQANGKTDLARITALLADAELKSASTQRIDTMIEAKARQDRTGEKGLMLQINKRIKEELGQSVTELKTDMTVQMAVTMIRQRCAEMLRETQIDYANQDWKDLDQRLKQSIYSMIRSSIRLFKELNGIAIH